MFRARERCAQGKPRKKLEIVQQYEQEITELQQGTAGDPKESKLQENVQNLERAKQWLRERIIAKPTKS